MRVIFMGTPDFAVPTLRALHQQGHEMVAVYSQPPRPAGRGQKETSSPVQAYAEANGLPVFTPVSLKHENLPDADVAVVAAYGLLLPKHILQAPRHGCLNVHPSLLPRWRGAAPIQRTIMAGDTETAMCIMQMDEGLDTGDILLCEPYAIPPGTDAGQLHDTMAETGARLMLEALSQLERGTLAPRRQSTEGVTYASKIKKEEARISWELPAREILHKILGLSPFPGATFRLGEEIIKVFAAVEAPGTDAAPGTLLDDRLTIACGSGTALRLLEVQRPGKKRMMAEEMLRGTPVPAGTKLN